MIVIPLLDLLFLVGTTFGAFTARGTWFGWLCTGLVFWQIWMLIQFIREHP